MVHTIATPPPPLTALALAHSRAFAKGNRRSACKSSHTECVRAHKDAVVCVCFYLLLVCLFMFEMKCVRFACTYAHTKKNNHSTRNAHAALARRSRSLRRRGRFAAVAVNAGCNYALRRTRYLGRELYAHCNVMQWLQQQRNIAYEMQRGFVA